jgi:hypothetical protein
MSEPRRIPETPAEHQLYAQLQAVVEVMASRPLPPGWLYAGPVDFLLQHGQFYTPSPRPPHVWVGLPQRCYGNALAMAVLHDLTYVEGSGLPDVGEGGLAIPHAWCAQAPGQAIEVTSEEPWGAYFGIAFSTGRADDATWEGDSCVLDDFRRRHPLLHQRWTGEDWRRVWPMSPPMRQLIQWREMKPVRPRSARR